jgi:hypothetical protein
MAAPPASLLLETDKTAQVPFAMRKIGVYERTKMHFFNNLHDEFSSRIHSDAKHSAQPLPRPTSVHRWEGLTSFGTPGAEDLRGTLNIFDI